MHFSQENSDSVEISVIYVKEISGIFCVFSLCCRQLHPSISLEKENILSFAALFDRLFTLINSVDSEKLMIFPLVFYIMGESCLFLTKVNPFI